MAAEVKKTRFSAPPVLSTAELHHTTYLYEELKTEWENPKPDLKKCGELLAELKIKLVSIRFLPASKMKVSRQELIFARNVLEIGVLWSVAVQDLVSFERYMSLLKCYYFDYKTQIPESPLKYQILGLNLLFLLCQSRTADFHTELELLPPEEILNNTFINYPVAIDQYLMEGSYNKIYRSKLTIPSKHYHVFVDILLETVRGEIAECIEKAYPKISVKEAAKKLYLGNEEAAKHYGMKVRKWRVRKDYFHFAKEDKREEDVESINLAESVLEYAKELEMIV